MKTMITTLLLLTSTAFAGGGSSSQPTYVTTCINDSGAKISLMFSGSSNVGFYLYTDAADLIFAKQSGTNSSGFLVRFREAGFSANYRSATNPLITSDFKQLGTLVVKQPGVSETYSCVRN